MSKQTSKLIELVNENPGLPIIPMVDGGIPGDDSGYWLGVFGYAAVDEFVISLSNLVMFKSDDDVFATLEHCLTDEEFEKLPETEEECRPFYDALPWTKAIIVYIDVNREVENDL